MNSLHQLFIKDVPVYFYPHQSHLISISIVTKVGSTAETDPIDYGMAHILEHLFFKGSKKRQLATSISRAANDIGARLNAYTHYDHTVYYITALKEHFIEAFDILADMYSYPLFPKSEFEKELQPILSELREREDDPSNFIFEGALTKYYGKSYHPIIGTQESILNASLEQLHSFRNKYYGGANVFHFYCG